MQAGAPSSASAAGFTGDDRFVSEYFRLELLSRLPPAEAQFLKYTSVLDRMCGGLCDAVLETTGSARHARARSSARTASSCRSTGAASGIATTTCSASCCATSSSAASRTWCPTLNRRAMAWCIANDLPEAAVVYGHAAGETDTVAGLVDALALPLYYDGRMETVEEWLGWFGDDELVRYPALAVYGAWFRALTGRPAEAERWLALADGATSTIPLSDGSATIEPWVATLRAHMMRDGVEQALADADLALDQLHPESGWIPVALAHPRRRACAARRNRSCDGRPHRSRRAGLAVGAVGRRLRRAGTARAPRGQAGSLGRGGGNAHGRHRRSSTRRASATTRRARSCTWRRRASHSTRRDRTMRARRWRARTACGRLLDHGIPWLTVQVGLELTRAHLALAEAGAARTILAETERVLELRPDLGSLVDEARELRDRVAATAGPAGAWAMSLTGAELRLLPYLATHLTFPEIASRLFISRNTVKTEAVSIYRKLGASSRSEAIERAVEVGLLDSSVYPPRANFTPEWMTRRRSAAGRIWPAPMDEYKQQLRRLAVHDDALLEATRGGRQRIRARRSSTSRTAALVRVAATVAVDAAPASFQHAVALALAAGATSDEIVASLEAVTPVTGAARVVQCAPKVALALGYDVDAALERLDP